MMKMRPEEQRAFNKALVVIVPTALFLVACVVYSIDRLLHWNELEFGFKIIVPVFLVLCCGVLVVLLILLSIPLIARLPNPFARLRRGSRSYPHLPVMDGEPADAVPMTQSNHIMGAEEPCNLLSFLEEDDRIALSRLDERTRCLLVNALPFGLAGQSDYEGPNDREIETGSGEMRITHHESYATITAVLSGCEGQPTSLCLPEAGLFDLHIAPAGDGFAVRFLYRTEAEPLITVDFTCSGISCLFEPVDLRPVLMGEARTLFERMLYVVREITAKSTFLGSGTLVPEENELLEAAVFLTSLESYRQRTLDLGDYDTLDAILAFLSGRHDSLHASFQSYRDGMSPDGQRPSRAVRKELDRELNGFVDSLDSQPILLALEKRIDQIMSRFPYPNATRIPGFEGLVNAADDFLQRKGFTGTYPEYRRNRKGRTDSVEFGFVQNYESSRPYLGIGIQAGIRNRQDEFSRICLFYRNRILRTDLGDLCNPEDYEAVRLRTEQILESLVRVLEGAFPDAGFLQDPLFRRQCVRETSRALAIVGWSAVGVEIAISLALIFNRTIDRWIGTASQGNSEAVSLMGIIILVLTLGLAVIVWSNHIDRIRRPKLLRRV
jgi:hypothetical protein